MTQEPRYIKFIYKISNDVLPEQEVLAKTAFRKAGALLEAEWSVTSPVVIHVLIMDDKSFRDGAKTGPLSWKFCFLLRDQPDNRVYCNVDIFSLLPDEAEKIIKHETAHIIVAERVGNFSTYQKSFFLEEGTAGFDGATKKYTKVLIKKNIKDIPDPLAIKSIDDVKLMGGDTNKEPFTDQLGYLTLFSFTEFLRKRHGEEKIILIYRTLATARTLEDAYEAVCSEKLTDVINEWESEIILLTR